MRLRRKYKYLIFGLEKKGMDGKNIVYDWKFYSHGPAGTSTSTESNLQRLGDNRLPMNQGTPSTSTRNETIPSTGTTQQLTAETSNQTNNTGTVTSTSSSSDVSKLSLRSSTSSNGTNGNTMYASNTMDNVTSWNSMMKELPQDDARFILFDYTAKANDGRNVQKIILIKYCPDSANVNTKMLMGSTHETLKRSLAGITKDVQACDTSDIDYKGIADSLVGV